MAFCSNCGAPLKDDEKFCSACGTPVEAATKEQPKADDSIDISEKVSAVLNSGEDRTAQFAADDINANKVFAVLAYFSWLVLIPIFAAPNSKFARFHANQGLIIAIAELCLWVIGLIPVLGWIVKWLGGIILVIFSILGIIAAAKGEAKTLPLIGKFVILK